MFFPETMNGESNEEEAQTNAADTNADGAQTEAAAGADGDLSSINAMMSAVMSSAVMSSAVMSSGSVDGADEESAENGVTSANSSSAGPSPRSEFKPVLEDLERRQVYSEAHFVLSSTGSESRLLK